VSDTALPPALAAFLRGIEPRARVLALAQAGPGLEAAPLLAAVRTDFVGRAARLPLAEWPLRYWGLLLARDELARPVGPTPAHPLYRLAHTRRLALLLRLVVGLDAPGAARVLGLSETAYRALLADAEEKLAELGVGPAVLVRWHEGFQQEVRASAAPEAGAGGAPARASGRAAAPPRAAPRAGRGFRLRLTPAQWGLAAVASVLLAVLAATFIWPPGALAPGPATAAEGPAPLQAAPSPSPRRDLDADLVVDPDFGLLASAPDAPWRTGVDLLSWWAVDAGVPLPAPAAAAPVAGALDWASLPGPVQTLLAPVRAAWPALDGPAQAALRGQAEAWLALDIDGREALRRAYAAWLARPALERAAQRAAFARWQALDDAERGALAAAAAALAALPPAEQQARRAAFAALDPQVREDWALGPRLGRQLPGLRPLLVHLPAAEQAALVDALDALPDARREALAARIAAMGAAERAALRGRVLAAEPAARSGLLDAAASP
jgi:hypothetical protein